MLRWRSWLVMTPLILGPILLGAAWRIIAVGLTVAGSLGGLIVTTLLVYALGLAVFHGTALDSTWHLLTLGILVSVVGQLGDLMFSSIKRDLGIKDFDVTIPGHGGLLDRFDSLVLIASVVFHYVNYFNGIGVGQAVRILTIGDQCVE